MFEGTRVESRRPNPRKFQNYTIVLAFLIIISLILRNFNFDFKFMYKFKEIQIKTYINITGNEDFNIADAVFYKKYIIQGNHKSDQKYIQNLVGNDIKMFVYFDHTSLQITNCTFYHFNNVYVNPAGGWTKGYNAIFPGSSTVPRFNTKNGPVSHKFNEVICIGNDWTNVFAHFVLDVLSLVEYVPVEIRKRSKFLLLSSSKVYHEMLIHFDIPMENIICPGQSFIFANNFYTVISQQSIHGALIGGLQNLSLIHI